jgi:hypothetical protein
MEQKMKYFIVVGAGAVLECWAKDVEAILGIVSIYDDDEKEHPVLMVLDVDRRQLFLKGEHAKG